MNWISNEKFGKKKYEQQTEFLFFFLDWFNWVLFKYVSISYKNLLKYIFDILRCSLNTN